MFIARGQPLKKSTALLLFLATLTVGGAVFHYGYPRTAAETKKPARAAPPVTVAPATVKNVPLILELVGRAEAHESVTLKARVDGQIAALPFKEGQTVTAGEVLARLDPADFDARLQQAEANLARDRAQLAKAQNDVQRLQTLKGRGFVSDQQLADARVTVDTMNATVQATQAAADVIRLQRSYTTIKAPFAGVIGARLVSPGATVKANDTALAVLNQVRPLDVSFSVPERHLPRLRAALRSGALPVVVTVPGHGEQTFPGEARFLDNAVDPTTGAIQMKATVANDAQALTPGQFLNINLTLDTLAAAVTVPAIAIQQGPQGAFVFVVKTDETVETRPVTVTLRQAETAVIGQGLSGGETVVTDGQLRLTPGAKVQIKAGGG